MKKALFAILISIFLLPAFAGETPTIGTAAPSFNLQDQNGDWHKLEDYNGQWLAVYFYPRDDTPGCTTEACNFRDNIYAFKAIGAAVVGISVDDVESHKEFSDKYKLPFTILADSDNETSTALYLITSHISLERDRRAISPEQFQKYDHVLEAILGMD